MAPILEYTLKSIVLLLIGAGGFAYMTLVERKFIGRLQSRIGPNRVGPFGLLQPMADGLKLIVKESITPAQADKLIFFIAPAISVIPALIIFAVIPFGNSPWLNLAANINIGVLYVLAVFSISVYGAVLGGWSSNNKYASLGGLRASAQMISYELALGLSLVAVVLMAGSASLNQIVQYQHPGNILGWLIFRQPVAAVLFAITAMAELARSPFDLVEAEQELTAGFMTEYSGMKFALFYMSEYVKMIAMSALFTTFFLGGWSGPGAQDSWLLSLIYFGIKMLVCLLAIVWTRATLPRFRYDKLMAFGWKVLLPIGLANVMVTALLIVLRVPGYR